MANGTISIQGNREGRQDRGGEESMNKAETADRRQLPLHAVLFESVGRQTRF